MNLNRISRFILCFFVIIGMLALPTYANDEIAMDASVVSGCHSADAQVALLGADQIVTNAESVFLYELNSETLLHVWNADASVEPSSLAKMMTAWIAIENAELTDAVTVKQSVLDSVPSGAASSDLVEDEVITLNDLLYCMMIDSGNDAAAVIADHVGGSQEAFVTMMNEKAKELNCFGTNFVNAHGLYHEKQITTARDMGKILAAAMKNETFAEIFAAVYYTVPATNKSEERKLVSGNYLMCTDDQQIYFDERATGGRTGVQKNGTRSLATVAEQSNMKLMCIVIGSASTYVGGGRISVFGGYKETTALLDTGFTGYYATQILYEGQVLTQRPVVNGSGKVSLGCAKAVATVLPEGVSINQLSFRYVDVKGDLEAPVNKNDVLGGVEVWYGGLCIAYTELYALNSVGVLENFVIQRKYDPTQWWEIVLIVLLVAAALVGVFFLLRYRFVIRRNIRNWQRKRRWKNRRGGR